MIRCFKLWLYFAIIALSFTPFSSIADQIEAPESSEIAAISLKSENLVQMVITPEVETIQPGSPFWVAIRLKVKDHWHAYWKNAGFGGMPISIEWQLPEGFQAGPLEWPYPERFNLNSMIGYGYTGDFVLLARITPPDSIADSSHEFSAKAKWVACSDSNCVPGFSQAKATLPIHAKSPQPQSQWADTFTHARALLPQKHLAAKAERKNGLIELRFELAAGQEKPRLAYFCPEQSEMIDETVEATLSAQKDRYVLVLRDTDAEEHSNILKGVIVLTFGEGVDTHVQALDIDVPIAGSFQADEIGMVQKTADPSLQSDPIPQTLSSQTEEEFGIALLFAFIGGMLLNLMPCVLPVVSLKILSFVKMAGQNRRLTLKHGLVFSSGVLISFWVLAGILIALKAYGQSVGWGFQLQEPLFVAGLAAILLMLALSLFGVLEIGSGVASLAGRAPAKTGSLLGSFGSGILATAVATPCTGPFLGSAIGFAMTAPALLSMLIFTALAFGMTLPYILLSAYPSLLRFLPKPGAWMITFKELMGFLMLATVLWLTWVFAAQTNSLSVILLLASYFFVAFGCWIYGRWATPVKSKTSRWISSIITLACFALGGYILWQTHSPTVLAYEDSSSLVSMTDSKSKDLWETFSPERVAELHKEGIPVIVDFTAKWCLICQANHIVLSTEAVNQRLADKGVVKMKADWTKSDPVITAELRKFGRTGVPLYLFYGTDPAEPPQILPQVSDSRHHL